MLNPKEVFHANHQKCTILIHLIIFGKFTKNHSLINKIIHAKYLSDSALKYT